MTKSFENNLLLNALSCNLVNPKGLLFESTQDHIVEQELNVMLKAQLNMHANKGQARRENSILFREVGLHTQLQMTNCKVQVRVLSQTACKTGLLFFLFQLLHNPIINAS